MPMLTAAIAGMTQKDNKMNILFVCSGNTCRSPMAEGYVNSLKREDLIATSAGFGFSGDEVSKNSVLAMADIGIDISAHRSRTLSTFLIDSADKIICMTSSHKNALLSAGVSPQKVSVLGNGIPDPYGGTLEVYKNCLREIVVEIDKLFCVEKPTVVPFKEEHARDIALIEEMCFSMPWSEKTILDSYAHGTRFFVAEKDGKAVGYCSISIVCDEGYIANIATHKNYRSKGIARAVLSAVISHALENRLEFITLEVRQSNTAAINLYKKFGFTEQAVRKNFYDDPKEDALIMTRRFN